MEGGEEAADDGARHEQVDDLVLARRRRVVPCRDAAVVALDVLNGEVSVADERQQDAAGVVLVPALGLVD